MGLLAGTGSGVVVEALGVDHGGRRYREYERELKRAPYLQQRDACMI